MTHTKRHATPQSKYIYLEYHSCRSPRWNWDCPTPSPASECVPPPHTPRAKGRGASSPADEGVGESQFGRLEKKLSILSILWATLLGDGDKWIEIVYSEVNGDSKSTNGWLVGWICRAGARDFCSTMSALVRKKNSPLFQCLCPHRAVSLAGSRAGSPVSKFGNCFEAESKLMLPLFYTAQSERSQHSFSIFEF